MTNYIKLLESYFPLLDACIITYSVTNNIIKGKVQWLGESDKQEFKWIIAISEKEAQYLSEVCAIIKSKGYNRNDKIIITEKQLLQDLLKNKWQKERANRLVGLLLNIEVKMIGDGDETGFFTFLKNEAQHSPVTQASIRKLCK